MFTFRSSCLKGDSPEAVEMWQIEKYQPGGKRPYLMARVEDFAALRAMIANRHHDRVEIIAPTDARAADIKKLRSLGDVHIQKSAK